MFINSNGNPHLFAHRDEDASIIWGPFYEEGNGTLEVDGTGQMTVTNTGGSSASEGGMGNDNMDDKSKGELKKTGEQPGESMRGDESEEDTRFDPIKKNVREAEKRVDKD